MYIRRIPLKDKKGKHKYFTYKLVESFRTERGPRQRIILNLGSDFSLQDARWKELANRIEEIMTDSSPLIPYPGEIETLAQTYAKSVLSKHSRPSVPVTEDEEPEFHTINIRSVKQRDVRTVGAEYLMLSMIREFGFDQFLRELGFRPPEVHRVLGLIVSRAVHPGSERNSFDWLRNNSALGDLIEVDYARMSLSPMYKASDRLLSKKEELETYLYDKSKQVFALTETLILYDLTNTYFEGKAPRNAKAKFGRSKEKRSDCPLVTLGLVLDEEGFCKRSKIFAGNVSEPITLDSMIKGLRSSQQLVRPVVVLDAGIATEENLKKLREQKEDLDYVVVSRKKKQEFPQGQTPVLIREEKGKHLRVVLKKNEKTGELELYCHSELKQKKEQSIKKIFAQRFEEELEKLRDGLIKKGSTKKHDKVLEKIGRLKEKYKRVSGLFEIIADKEEKGENTKTIQWSLKAQKDRETLNGFYCLRTNLEGMDERRIWNIYVMLTEVEEAFRSMKSELGLRPIFHQKESRVDGHLFLTVLAYQFVHSIRYRLKKEGIHFSWKYIRERMSSHIWATVQMKDKGGSVISIRKSSEPEPFHKSIYVALKLNGDVGKSQITIV